MSIAGVILAGGEGRRLPGKPLRRLGGVPLVMHVVRRARPQVGRLCISLAEPSEAYAAFALPVVVDETAERIGPIAGLLAGLRWAAALGAARLATFPCDAPFLPSDLVRRLAEGAADARLAVASAGGRVHPTFALWDVTLAGLAGDAVASGERRLLRLVESAGAATVDFADSEDFLNVNSEEDLAAAEALLDDGR